MPTPFSELTALDLAISDLTQILNDRQPTCAECDIDLVRRQLDLLNKAQNLDRVMAEKIAEDFGYGRAAARLTG